MKLSEILGWPEKKNRNLWPSIVGAENHGFNKALVSCDREIDREALANVLYKICIMTEFHSNRKVDYLIATMPTWLKRIER